MMAIITIDTSPFIGILDTLTAASIRTDALYMSASHLDDMHKDAMQMLASDCDQHIQMARDAIETLLVQAKEAMREEARHA